MGRRAEREPAPPIQGRPRANATSGCSRLSVPAPAEGRIVSGHEAIAKEVAVRLSVNDGTVDTTRLTRLFGQSKKRRKDDDDFVYDDDDENDDDEDDNEDNREAATPPPPKKTRKRNNPPKNAAKKTNTATAKKDKRSKAQKEADARLAGRNGDDEEEQEDGEEGRNAGPICINEALVNLFKSVFGAELNMAAFQVQNIGKTMAGGQLALLSSMLSCVKIKAATEADLVSLLGKEAGARMLDGLVSVACKNANVAEKRFAHLTSDAHQAYLQSKMSKEWLELEKLKQENLRKRIQLASATATASFAHKHELIELYRMLFQQAPDKFWQNVHDLPKLQGEETQAVVDIFEPSNDDDRLLMDDDAYDNEFPLQELAPFLGDASTST